MRLVLCLSLLLVTVFSSCKKARIYRRIDGSWLFYKRLEVDGSYSQHHETYTFSKGKLSKSKEYPMQIIAQDTTQLTYKVIKSDVIQFRFLSKDSTYNWLLEDMDNKTMVARAAEGVMFFEKQ